MSSDHPGSIDSRPASASSRTTVRAFFRTFVLLIAVTRIPVDVSAAETVEARYRRAIAGLGQFRNNMNGLWFGFTSEHRYAINGSPIVEETRGVIYYSESMIYLACLHDRAAPQRPRWLSHQTEAIISDHWGISTNQLVPSQIIDLAEWPDSASNGYARFAYPLLAPADIASLFENRVGRFVTHPFSKPHIDAQGRLVVLFSQGEAIRETDPAVQLRHHLKEVIFSSDSDLKPVRTLLLKTLPNGESQQLGVVDVQYGQTSQGTSIIRRIQSSARQEDLDEVPDIANIQIREIECPEWMTMPPRVSVTSRPVTVRRLNADGLPPVESDQLPAEAEDLIRRLDNNELRQQSDIQRKSLESMDAFVLAAVISPEPAPTFDAAPERELNLPSAYTVPSILGAIVVAIAGLWIILWKRAYSRRP